MKKALLVTRVSGFVPQFEMNNVKILMEMGYEIHYAANFDTVVYGNDNSRLDGTKIIRHHIPFGRSPFSKDVKKCTRMLVDLMYEEDFDLIHCHMPMTGVLTRRAAEKVSIRTSKIVPVLYTCHGFHFFSGAPLKNWLYYFPERYYARYTDGLILINDEDYKRAKKWKVRGKVYKIPGVGISLEEYEKKSTEEDVSGISIRDRYNIPELDTIIVSVGEINAGKNHQIVIEAMKEFRDKPVTYMICGEGVLRKELENRVKEYGLEDKVIFTGYTKNVKEILRQADIFVHPSKREGLPVAVMEAMASGLPVIAMDIRGNKDLIEEGEGGCLLSVDYAPSYAERFRALIESPMLRARMGAWNKERVKEFSIEKVEKVMRAIYQAAQYDEGNSDVK